MAHDVFVSHASHDKPAAAAVVAALEENAIRCWVAPRDILAGESWASSILRAIERSRLVVLVFSARANDSEHIRREIERAVNHRVPIAAVRIEEVFPAGDLEYFLSASQWMDAISEPLEQHLPLLVECVRRLLDRRERPAAARPPPASLPADAKKFSLRRRFPLVVGAGSAIALAGVAGGIWMFGGSHLTRAPVESSARPAAVLRTTLVREDQQPRLAATAARLRSLLELSVDVPAKADSTFSAWPVAEAVVAISDGSRIDTKKVVSFFRDVEADSTVHGWHLFNRPISVSPVPIYGDPAHIAATAWVLWAMARLHTVPTPEELDFLLANQNARGWWPAYQGLKENERAGSAYATAHAVLALDELAKQGLLTDAQLSRAKEAIRRGVAWLVNKRVPSSARWRTYPDIGTTIVSVGVSGLIVHLLHETGVADTADLDHTWLATLADNHLQRVDEHEQDGAYLETAPGIYRVDSTRYLKFPWSAIATVDAYANGTEPEKQIARQWIDKFIDEVDIANAELLPPDDAWKRSEIYMGLSRLQSSGRRIP